MLTSRDYQVIDFLEYYKIATTTTIQRMIFGSKRVTQRRLKELFDAGKVKRIRTDLNSEYLYYLKMPKQMRHSAMVTEFLGDFSGKYRIDKFVIEPDFQTMRPDAFIAYSDQRNNMSIAFLEVELSNKGFDFNKYERYASDQCYRNIGMPYMPPVYIVGNVKSIPQSSRVKYIKYDLKTNL